MADEGNPPARKRRRTDRNDPDATKIAQKSPKKTATCDQKGMDMRTKLREKFKVEFPQDFFDFWELCKKLSSASPTEALSSPLGLKLVGPYDVLSGRSDDVDDADITSYHLHWRYYYDPPEFLTVIKGDDDTGYHMGYYRDDPKSLPVFVASNQAQKSCEFAVLGENLFAAINQFIGDFMKTSKSKQKSLKALQSCLTSEAKELKYSLETSTPAIKARKKKVVSKTFHKAGIVVPVDSNDVGYRPLTVTDGELKKILQRITEGKNEKEREQASDDLQEIMTLIQFANDECDYGMGLELGVDLFCFGSERFHKTMLQLMPLAYRLLGRDEFAEIVEVHVNHRCRASLSQLPS